MDFFSSTFWTCIIFFMRSRPTRRSSSSNSNTNNNKIYYEKQSNHYNTHHETDDAWTLTLQESDIVLPFLTCTSCEPVILALAAEILYAFINIINYFPPNVGNHSLDWHKASEFVCVGQQKNGVMRGRSEIIKVMHL